MGSVLLCECTIHLDKIVLYAQILKASHSPAHLKPLFYCFPEFSSLFLISTCSPSPPSARAECSGSFVFPFALKFQFLTHAISVWTYVAYKYACILYLVSVHYPNHLQHIREFKHFVLISMTVYAPYIVHIIIRGRNCTVPTLEPCMALRFVRVRSMSVLLCSCPVRRRPFHP